MWHLNLWYLLEQWKTHTCRSILLLYRLVGRCWVIIQHVCVVDNIQHRWKRLLLCSCLKIYRLNRCRLVVVLLHLWEQGVYIGYDADTVILNRDESVLTSLQWEVLWWLLVWQTSCWEGIRGSLCLIYEQGLVLNFSPLWVYLFDLILGEVGFSLMMLLISFLIFLAKLCKVVQ